MHVWFLKHLSINSSRRGSAFFAFNLCEKLCSVYKLLRMRFSPLLKCAQFTFEEQPQIKINSLKKQKEAYII